MVSKSNSMMPILLLIGGGLALYELAKNKAAAQPPAQSVGGQVQSLYNSGQQLYRSLYNLF